MREPAEAATVKPGRCVHHPGVSAVGSCEVCHLPLCVACAVPVRGTLIGPECLSTVLATGPAIRIPPPLPHRGDWAVRAGFGLVVALSLIPWSRVGEGSGLFGAWAGNWSLLAAVAGLAGLAITLLVRYRAVDPRVEIFALALLAALVGAGALLHLVRPPLLSEASLAPPAALVGAALTILGVVLKGRALLEARGLRS